MERCRAGQDPSSAVLTAPQLAAALGLDRGTVTHHCRAGHLPGAVRLGRDWLVPARYADPAVYRAAVGRPGRRTGQSTRSDGGSSSATSRSSVVT